MLFNHVRCARLIYITSYLLPLIICVSQRSEIFAADDPPNAVSIDEIRAERYATVLKNLTRNRVAMMKQCQAIVNQDQYLERAVWQDWVTAVNARQNAIGTPQFQATPLLTQFGRQNRFDLAQANNNANGVWFATQDNSMLKLAWANKAFAAQADAQLIQQTLANHRFALLDISDSVDRNFEEFRSRVDWTGKRSRAEHIVAQEIAEQNRATDPRGAGLTLIHAAALRSMGDYDECLDRMDEIDDYFQKLQIIHMAYLLQIEFLNGNDDAIKRIAPEATTLANEYGIIEPLLVRTWIAIANEQWSEASSSVVGLRKIAPDYLEGAIAQAWLWMLTNPRKSKDTLSMLRAAAIRKSSDDWDFDEAMANAYAHANDWKFAQKHIEAAVKAAPEFILAELTQQAQDIKNHKLPTIDWDKRLRQSWTLK